MFTFYWDERGGGCRWRDIGSCGYYHSCGDRHPSGVLYDFIVILSVSLFIQRLKITGAIA